ncbi:EXOSC8 isoform 4 [Pan troglodytes]|uniref:Exosome component 8 n=2 Tax=Homininae TaxID=207598 RepID=H7C5Z2_HUMAN|nr:EXOSC8 isoform 4 [Pan troglodytes]
MAAGFKKRTAVLMEENLVNSEPQLSTSVQLVPQMVLL